MLRPVTTDDAPGAAPIAAAPAASAPRGGLTGPLDPPARPRSVTMEGCVVASSSSRAPSSWSRCWPACGSSGGSAATDTSTTSRPPGTTIERRIAQAGLLDPADLPGFQKVATLPSEILDLDASATAGGPCDFYRTGRPPQKVTGRSASAQRGSTTVSSSLAIYADAATAQKELELFRDPRMADCLKEVYVPDGTPADVTPIAASDLGDDQVAYRITRDTSSGTAPTQVIDVHVVRVGPAVFSVNVIGSPANAAEVQSTALPTLVNRIRAAGA